MLFEIKSAGCVINLGAIFKIKKIGEGQYYEVSNSAGYCIRIDNIEYQEIKKYFDVKNLKGVFVDGAKVAESVKAMMENETELKGGVVGGGKISLEENFKRSIGELNEAWRNWPKKCLPDFIDNNKQSPFSGHSLSKEEIEKQSLENRSKDVVDSIANAINAKKPKHFDAWFFINTNQIHDSSYVLSQLVKEKIIKSFDIESRPLKSLITITKV